MNIRVRAMTILLATLALTGATVGALSPPSAAAPGRPGAPAQPADCETDQSGTHVGVGCGDENSGDPSNPGGPGDGDGGGGIDPAEACADYPGWRDCQGFVAMNGIHPDDMCGYMIDPNQEYLDYYQPDAPEGALLRTWICPREGTVYTEDTDWVMGGGPPPPPDPEDVAADVWAEVQAELLPPELETWPPQNMSSVLKLPSFVAVDNWQGTQTESDCDGPTCVTLTATPALTYDPGDGEPVVDCEPGGTTFDRYGAEPDEQAEGEACAHAFVRRTGVDDRPDAWPGEVSITWDAHWEEDVDGGGGEEGDFDPLVLSADLARVVTEWVSVLTNVAPSGGR